MRPGIRSNAMLADPEAAAEEDKMIMQMVEIHGTKWSQIAKLEFFKGRTAAWSYSQDRESAPTCSQQHRGQATCS